MNDPAYIAVVLETKETLLGSKVRNGFMVGYYDHETAKGLLGLLNSAFREGRLYEQRKHRPKPPGPPSPPRPIHPKEVG